jgi:hypothetical protein
VGALPSVNESFDRLHRAGWSIGESAGAIVWLVTGTNGENVICAEGSSQAEAWYRATLQAEVVGMLAPSQRDDASCLGLRGRGSRLP